MYLSIVNFSGHKIKIVVVVVVVVLIKAERMGQLILYPNLP